MFFSMRISGLKQTFAMVPLLLILLAGCELVRGNPDEVLDLPGLPSQPSFKQYSGYLNATNNRFLHYWFVESEQNPATDPVLLWLNGGPGCSSLDGFLAEHGPFRAINKGKSLIYNDFSWNKFMSVLYLEAPAGVGFSYSTDKKYGTDDDQVSLDNYVALQSFFEKFPQFSKNDFYISGESYGGIYVPTLSVRVLNGTAPINFKGFLVGNGMSSFPLNTDSLMFFFYHHGLIESNVWNKVTKYCCSGSISQTTCNFHDNSNPNCLAEVADITNTLMTSGLNPYNLYDVCAMSTFTESSRFFVEFTHLHTNINLNVNYPPKAFLPPNSEDRIDPPCVDTSDMEAYLNRPDVQTALHIAPGLPHWSVCSTEVSANYKIIYSSMEDQYHFLLRKVRGLVFNGDVDMACNFLGDEWFVESLGRQILSNYTYWKVDNQVAGFVKQYDNLDFVTIRGAGHMVPENKPKEALKMLTSFIYKKPY